MFLHICFHRPARRIALGLAACGGQRAVGFQRKFGIDTDRARRRWHIKQAIDAAAIAKRVLETEGAFGKRVTNQIFQLHLAKTATRLLIRQDVLQLANLPGQRRDMGVRLLDHGKFLGHAGKRAVGAVILVAKRVFKAGAKAALGFLHLRGDSPVKVTRLRGKLRQLALQLGQRRAILPAGSLAYQHEDKPGDNGQRKKDDDCIERHG